MKELDFVFDDMIYKIDENMITDTAVVSCEKSSDGIYVDFNYSYNDYDGYGDYVCVIYDNDDIDNNEMWEYLKNVAKCISEKYKVELYVYDN